MRAAGRAGAQRLAWLAGRQDGRQAGESCGPECGPQPASPAAAGPAVQHRVHPEQGLPTKLLPPVPGQFQDLHVSCAGGCPPPSQRSPPPQPCRAAAPPATSCTCQPAGVWLRRYELNTQWAYDNDHHIAWTGHDPVRSAAHARLHQAAASDCSAPHTHACVYLLLLTCPPAASLPPHSLAERTTLRTSW